MFTTAFKSPRCTCAPPPLTLMYLRLLPLAILACCLWACDNGTVVEIPIPEHEVKPVLSVDMRAGDSTLFVALDFSRSILENQRTTTGEGRLVILRDGETIFDREIRLPAFNDRADGDGFELTVPVSNQPARFEAILEVEGYETVTATQQMPAPPRIGEITYDPDGAFLLDGVRADGIEFDITDDPNDRNFYGVRVLSIYYRTDCSIQNGSYVCDTIGFEPSNELWTQTSDPGLRNAHQYGHVFTDESFQGGTKTVRLVVDNYNNNKVMVEVTSLTEDAYRYGLTHWVAEEARYNPFSEPVNVHENVTNGHGQFLVVNRTLVIIE